MAVVVDLVRKGYIVNHDQIEFLFLVYSNKNRMEMFE